MKFTLAWLKDHLETDASLDDITTTLSAIGLEVDNVENPAETLSPFVVARIKSARQHPNADRLQVCDVEIAKGRPTVEVVCGAKNARKGLTVVFAPLGTYIPGSGMTLEERPVRGVVSNGMLVSDEELGLADTSKGIIEVPDELGAEIGQRYIDVLGMDDVTIEVDLTPNRPDCTGVRGIARDLAAAGLGKLKPLPDFGAVEGKSPCPVDIALEFDTETADACPVFAGRVIEGLKNGPSPAWLQARLKAIGLKPRNALVDVTNYILFDCGRPLHVYDADKLTGTVRARLGRDGESFVGLGDEKNEVRHRVDDTMCVIADDSDVLGLGGVLGGKPSGSSEETTRVLIESAWFDPVRTAQTGRKAGLNTDARYRFERGVDPASVLPGLDYATRMILDICGGKPSKACVAGAPPAFDRRIDFDPARVGALTGLAVKDADIKNILKSLGFLIAGKGSNLKVTVPSWRPDVHGAADLVEEVARIVGIDNVPSTPMRRESGVARPVLTRGQARVRRARRVLSARGLVEAITWSFIPRAHAEAFGGGGDDVELANPISSEMSSMRPGLLPGLVAAVQRNRNRGIADVALFEVGQCYASDDESDQHTVAAGVRAGSAVLAGAGRHWDGASADVDAFDVKADVAAVLGELGVDAGKAQITRDAPDWYHPGRSGTLRLGPKTVLAHFGELHPLTLKALDTSAPLAAFEVHLDALPQRKRKTLAKPPLDASDLLPVRRDFAFVLDRDVAAGDVIRAASNADKALIRDVLVFDVFEGGGLADEGKKSLALEVTLQPTAETLTDKQIEAIAERVVAAVKKATGGEIRG